MKKLIYAIAVFGLLASCKQQTENIVKEVEKSEKINPIQDPNLFIGKHKTKAMILGVFHFDDPGLDSYKSKYEVNVLEDQRQEEIEYLLEKIAQFKPTKILLEFPRIKGDSIMNAKYKKFLDGKFDISNEKNEWYQLGFKLAKKLNHNRIYSVDASAKWCGPNLDWDNFDEDTYLKELNQYDKSSRYDFEKFYNLGDSLTTTLTLTDYFAYDNNPKIRLKDHQAYLTGNVIRGAGDNYLGASSVSKWYQRNIKIFANTLDVTDFDNEEKLLLIFGSGHVWQLRQLFLDSPDFEYIEVNTYLTE